MSLYTWKAIIRAAMTSHQYSARLDVSGSNKRLAFTNGIWGEKGMSFYLTNQCKLTWVLKNYISCLAYCSAVEACPVTSMHPVYFLKIQINYTFYSVYFLIQTKFITATYWLKEIFYTWQLISLFYQILQININIKINIIPYMSDLFSVTRENMKNIFSIFYLAKRKIINRIISHPSRRSMVVDVTSVNRTTFPRFCVCRFCLYISRLKCAEEKASTSVTTGMSEGVISDSTLHDDSSLRDTLLETITPSAFTFLLSHSRKELWTSCWIQNKLVVFSIFVNVFLRKNTWLPNDFA